MKTDFTRIAIVLDRSGSMEPLREATVEGINQFLRAQQQLPGSATVKLVRFDTEYEVVFDKPLHEVPLLTQEDFVPRGATALLDAQGKTIDDLGEELARMPETARPAKVIVVTLTDGLENASKYYTGYKVAEMIKRQREIYSWEFIYLGANQDAVKVAASMNIPAAAAMTYAPSPRAVGSTFSSLASYVSRTRGGEKADFTAAERATAIDENV
jgi:hypothetical protein